MRRKEDDWKYIETKQRKGRSAKMGKKCIKRKKGVGKGYWNRRIIMRETQEEKVESVRKDKRDR